MKRVETTRGMKLGQAALRVQYQMPQYCAKTAGDQEKNHLPGGKTLPKQGSQDFAS